jgi:hypothetical protein
MKEFQEKQVYKNRRSFLNQHPCSLICLFFGLLSFRFAFVVSELTPSYLNELSLTIGVYFSIVLLIFYVEYRWNKKEMNKSVTVEKYGGVMITESVIRGRNLLVIILLGNIGFWIFVSVGMVGRLGGIIAILVLSIIWILTGLFTFCVYSMFLKGTSKLRKVIINEEYIQILVPPKPIFHINWIEIDRIEVSKQPKTKFFIIKLKFIGKNYDKTFHILGGRDFNIKLKEILGLLENYAISLNKKFITSYILSGDI